MLTQIHVLCDCYTKIFRGLNVFQSLLMQSVVNVSNAESLSVIVIPRYFADWTFPKFADSECNHEWFVFVSNVESLS